MTHEAPFEFDDMSQEIVPVESENTEMTHFERQQKFEEVFRSMLPHLDSHIGKSVMAQTIITLKLEGLVGEELTESDLKMLKAVQESVMQDDERRNQAIRFSQRLIT
jgi:hypothetical protein